MVNKDFQCHSQANRRPDNLNTAFHHCKSMIKLAACKNDPNIFPVLVYFLINILWFRTLA